MSDEYREIIEKAIDREREIIGDVTLDIARRTEGLEVDEEGKVRRLEDGKEVFSELVDRYEEALGELHPWLLQKPYNTITTPASNKEKATVNRKRMLSDYSFEIVY